MKTEDIKVFTPKEHAIYPQHYFSTNKQYDKYYLFVERAYNLLKENGKVGYILPNKFIKIQSACKLREFITGANPNGFHALKSFTFFGANQVFKGKTTYTCILVLEKAIHNSFIFADVKNLNDWRLRKEGCKIYERTSSILGAESWNLLTDEQQILFDKIKSQSTTLNEVVNLSSINPNGIQTSKSDAYVFKPTREDDVYYYFVYNNKEWSIEKSITRPYYKTARGFEELNTYRSVVINARLIFPYTIKGDKATLIPLKKLQSKYPKALEYFTSIKEVLLDRKMSSNKNLETEWYRYGRSQNLTDCNVPIKIIVGNLSNGDKYAIDKQQIFVPAGGTAGYSLIILPKDVSYSIYYVQALLNSVQAEWFSLVYGDFFRGNFISRGTRFNGELPFYKIDFENTVEVAKHDDIVERQKKLISLGDRIAAAGNNSRRVTPLKRQFELLKAEQQQAINDLYGMTEEEVTLIPKIKELYAAD